MSVVREMSRHIASIRDISQVTRAMQAVSDSKVRKAVRAVAETQPYATKAWEVLRHLASQPGRDFIHPLLNHRSRVRKTMVILLTSDRSLAGAYNANIIEFAMKEFRDYPCPVEYVLVGKQGLEALVSAGVDVVAEFRDLPEDLAYSDVSAIGRLAMDEFLDEKVDEVFIVYTDYGNMTNLAPALRKLLPFDYQSNTGSVSEYQGSTEERSLGYIYEPSQNELLDEIIPSFTSLQIYQAMLVSVASENASRKIAMQKATDNALELVDELQLKFNKARQQSITNEMLDIIGGTIR